MVKAFSLYMLYRRTYKPVHWPLYIIRHPIWRQIKDHQVKSRPLDKAFNQRKKNVAFSANPTDPKL